jgi:putative DNA primase/helicase
LAACGFSGVSHALVFPYHALDGSQTGFSRYKIFYSGDSDGKPKYWQPNGTDPEAYLAPLRNWSTVAQDATTPLTVPEGEKKALSGLQIGLHCLGIAGVWSWRAKFDNGVRLVLPTLDQFLWKCRPVELVPDSDAWRPEKEADILRGFYALGHELKDRGAVVSFVELPEYNGVKCGLDDFIVKVGAFPLETFTGCKRYALDDRRFKKLAAWHQKWSSRQRDNDDKGLTKILADEILKQDHFAKDASGQLHVFRDGVYRPEGKTQIAQRVKRILELNGDTAKWSSHRVKEVAIYIEVDAAELWERPKPDVLNLHNGLLDLTTSTLLPHTPKHLSPIQLPISFDPTSTCPLWESFASRILPDDCQRFPFELIASAMRGDISDQKAALLIGCGENGKSVLLSAVVSFLGKGNISNLALQRLEDDRFAVVRLLGKLANVCADLPAHHLVSTSIFKALTGGDRLTGERKFQESFEFTPFARLIFSTNHYPQSKDASHAFFRRWHVVFFDAVIDPRERIPNLAALLANPQELSGVLNRAIATLPGMIERGGFSISESTQAAMMEFREMTDPLAAWLDQYTVLASEDVVSKKDLCIAYNAHAEGAARPVMSAKSFCTAVRRLRPTVKEAQRSIHGSVQWVFLGLGMGPSRSSSLDSRHSRHSSQISLRVDEEREGENKSLKRQNDMIGAKELKRKKGHVIPCFTCHGTSFWLSVHGSTVCGFCHPPMSPALVTEWLGNGSMSKGRSDCPT